MAADVLLYQATHVPVGDDQTQHIELVKDVAISMNHLYGQSVFTVPEQLTYSTSSKRVMSLRDATKKMSKSDPSESSRVLLTDDDELIVRKFRKAKTDLIGTIDYEPKTRPDISNLIGIYSALSGASVEDICRVLLLNFLDDTVRFLF